MTKKKLHKPGSATIALNKRARHEYFIEQEIEAGLSLQGWEVKSLRAGKANISDSYVLLKDGEAWLFGATITPLNRSEERRVGKECRSWRSPYPLKKKKVHKLRRRLLSPQ